MVKGRSSGNTTHAGAGINLGSVFSVNVGIAPPNDEVSHALGAKSGKVGNHIVAYKCCAYDTPIFPGERNS